MQPLNFYFNHPGVFFSAVVSNLGFWLPDKLYLRLLFRAALGYWPDLKTPKTYNEKLQWQKLYDHNPSYTTMVDKITAKEYVSNIIGDKYIIPTLGVWNSFDEIDFDQLPNKFVLKTNSGGGGNGVVICKNKASFNKDKARMLLMKSMKESVYRTHREWPYKNIKPKIFAESFLEEKGSSNSDLRDYKFFCFGGKVQALFVASDRNNPNVTTKFDYMDANYNRLNLWQSHPMSDHLPQKPSCFEDMKNVAEKLSAGIPQVRVDLYEVNGAIYFGEMTFFHYSGLTPFFPKEENWDYKWGQWIELPEKQK